MTAQGKSPGRLDARTAALRALGDLRTGRRTARQAIEALVESYPLESRDVALAMELAHGVVRHRLTLARLINSLTAGRWRKVNHWLQNILLLGAYQIVWLDHIPVFAAVNEAVNQAKAEGGIRSGKFANAVLRELERQIETRRVPIGQADPQRSILLSSRTACQFRQVFMPDPLQQPIDFLSTATSHPAWLVSRWMDAYGPEQTKQICVAGLERPPLFLRPNLVKTSAAGLVERLRSEGLEAQATPDGMVVLGDTGELTRSSTFAEGWFQPQDPTATLPVRDMFLSSGERVLDLCAGLGTKTMQIAEAVGEGGFVLATDIDPARLNLLRANSRRLGHTVVATAEFDSVAQIVGLWPRLDWILLDVPCSNTGVLGRRPEARYRLNPPSLTALADQQLALLGKAAAMARTETRLMYSTCSIDPEENEQVCSRFLTAHPEWSYEQGALTLPACGEEPADWHDGGYRAMLERRPSRD